MAMDYCRLPQTVPKYRRLSPGQDGISLCPVSAALYLFTGTVRAGVVIFKEKGIYHAEYQQGNRKWKGCF